MTINAIVVVRKECAVSHLTVYILRLHMHVRRQPIHPYV
jgi:hypothetical protein